MSGYKKCPGGKVNASFITNRDYIKQFIDLDQNNEVFIADYSKEFKSSIKGQVSKNLLHNTDYFTNDKMIDISSLTKEFREPATFGVSVFATVSPDLKMGDKDGQNVIFTMLPKDWEAPFEYFTLRTYNGYIEAAHHHLDLHADKPNEANESVFYKIPNLDPDNLYHIKIEVSEEKKILNLFIDNELVAYRQVQKAENWTEFDKNVNKAFVRRNSKSENPELKCAGGTEKFVIYKKLNLNAITKVLATYEDKNITILEDNLEKSKDGEMNIVHYAPNNKNYLINTPFSLNLPKDGKKHDVTMNFGSFASVDHATGGTNYDNDKIIIHTNNNGEIIIEASSQNKTFKVVKNNTPYKVSIDDVKRYNQNLEGQNDKYNYANTYQIKLKGIPSDENVKVEPLTDQPFENEAIGYELGSTVFTESVEPVKEVAPYVPKGLVAYYPLENDLKDHYGKFKDGIPVIKKDPIFIDDAESGRKVYQSMEKTDSKGFRIESEVDIKTIVIYAKLTGRRHENNYLYESRISGGASGCLIPWSSRYGRVQGRGYNNKYYIDGVGAERSDISPSPEFKEWHQFIIEVSKKRHLRNFIIGNHDTSDGYSMNGVIKDMYIYDRYLTEEEKGELINVFNLNEMKKDKKEKAVPVKEDIPKNAVIKTFDKGDNKQYVVNNAKIKLEPTVKSGKYNLRFTAGSFASVDVAEGRYGPDFVKVTFNGKKEIIFNVFASDSDVKEPDIYKNLRLHSDDNSYKAAIKKVKHYNADLPEQARSYADIYDIEIFDIPANEKVVEVELHCSQGYGDEAIGYQVGSTKLFTK